MSNQLNRMESGTWRNDGRVSHGLLEQRKPWGEKSGRVDHVRESKAKMVSTNRVFTLDHFSSGGEARDVVFESGELL